MKEFTLYIFQSCVCLSAFLIVYFFFLRKKTFFLFNRVFLVVGLIAAFVLPIIRFSYDVIVPLPAQVDVGEVEVVSESSGMVGLTVWHGVIALYLIGIFFALVKNFNTYRKLKSLKKNAIITKVNNCTLIRSEEVDTPFSVFNSIYLNDKRLGAREEVVILKHEMNHVAQKHWFDLLFGECALMLQWFNPLMWYYVHLLKENHEYLADKAVIDSGESLVVYRAILINQRFQGSIFSLANSFNYSKYGDRLAMMEQNKTSSWKKAVSVIVLPLVAIFYILSADPNYISVESSEEKEESAIVVKGYKKGEELVEFSTRIEESIPLYIVDGKEINSEVLGALNAESIESISILKNKSATDLYGDEGKNGVILITTKNKSENTLQSPKLPSMAQEE